MGPEASQARQDLRESDKAAKERALDMDQSELMHNFQFSNWS